MEDHRIVQFSSVQFIAAVVVDVFYLLLLSSLCSALLLRQGQAKIKKERKKGTAAKRKRKKKKKKTLRLYSVAPYALKQTQMDGHRVGGCANHRRVSAYAACVPERQL